MHAISVLVASAVGDEEYRSKVSAETLIVTRDQDKDNLAPALVSNLTAKYGLQNCSIVKYTELSNRDLKNTLCVSLVELERSVLADLTEEEYANIRHLLSTCEGLLWVTGDFTSNPELNMIAGLIRRPSASRLLQPHGGSEISRGLIWSLWPLLIHDLHRRPHCRLFSTFFTINM